MTTDNDHGYRDADHLRHLADRCERGAETLTYEGEHAAEVLATRANGDRADPQEWAAGKQAAAAAAREHAAGLRAEADALTQGQRPSQERVDQAEKVATAAECGGILIDGHRLNEAALANPFGSAEMRQATKEHEQAERAAVEGSGLFAHVAETIDGVEQVPFWRLGATSSAEAATADDDADGW